MDLSRLEQYWPSTAPWQAEHLHGGVNNLTYRVTGPQGQVHVLRVYQNTRDPARLLYEARLMDHLQNSGLSFAVPAPLPTRGGDRFVQVETPQGEALAILMPRISGAIPELDSMAEVQAGGAALGELTRSLAGYHPTSTDGANPPYGDLERCHPAIPDPLAAPGLLEADRETRLAVQRLLESVHLQAPALYASLPRQMIHGDFVRWNVLMHAAQVRGVLDFEFATPDIAALDFAIALGAWPGRVWGTGREWQVIETFSLAYLRHWQLTPAELEAVPVLMQMRRAASVLHHLGRRLVGLNTEADLLRVVGWTVQNEEWLAQNRGKLLDLLYACAWASVREGV